MKSWTKHLQPSAGTGGCKLLQGGTMNWCFTQHGGAPASPAAAGSWWLVRLAKRCSSGSHRKAKGSPLVQLLTPLLLPGRLGACCLRGRLALLRGAAGAARGCAAAAAAIAAIL